MRDAQDPANQLFCADPELIAIGAKLANAIQERLNRIPDRLPAIEENAEWLQDRNQSCGIFGNDPIRSGDIEPIVACLSKETEERIAILRDPNFDCLAASTAAGTLICSEPSLAEADSQLNGLVRGLIDKLKDEEAKDAAAEYARWIRDRDRRCRLAGKDNLPLAELSSAQDCLENYLKEMTAGMRAAKGDPKRVFLRELAASRPNVDAVDLCVTRIHRANACDNFLRVRRVVELRHPGDRAERPGHGPDRDGRARSLLGVQPGCIELHRHMLGHQGGQAGAAAAAQPGQFRRDEPHPDRKILRISEDREWPLALQFIRAEASRFRDDVQRSIATASAAAAPGMAHAPLVLCRAMPFSLRTRSCVHTLPRSSEHGRAARGDAAVREEIAEHFARRKIRRYKFSFLISHRSFD